MDMLRQAAATIAATAGSLLLHSCALVSALYIVAKLEVGERLANDSRFVYMERPLTDEEHIKTYKCRRWAAAKGSYRLTLRVADGVEASVLEEQARLLHTAEAVQHVLRWVASFRGPNGSYCLVTESLMYGLPLLEALAEPGKMDLGRPERADMSRQLAQQLLQALAGLHQLNIVHRNVHAGCVYYSNLKDEQGQRLVETTLVDFSSALVYQPGGRVDGEMSHGRAVAGGEVAAWAAPELLEAALLGAEAGFAIEPPAADMWALGCLLLLLHSGEVAFKAGSLQVLRKQHRQWAAARKAGKGEHPILVALDGLPRECASLIASLLISDPVRRASAAYALMQPYFATSIKY